MNRRETLKLLGAGALAVAGGCTTGERAVATAMPSLFVAHGSPTLLDDATWSGALARWASSLPRPQAILMLSAHWEERPPTLGATTTVPLVYDFYGFPQKYYQQRYAAPGAPDLATRVRAMLGARGPVADDPIRGLDHGAYVPLVAMYPAADVPVLQLSLPSVDPTELFTLGRALGPLRDEGVLVVGSGHLTHNLRLLDLGPHATTPAWAAEFDAWTADALARKDVDALLDYRTRAPGVQQALPTHEHFVPVLAALGAAVDGTTEIAFPVTGFVAGSLTKRSVQFGAPRPS